MEKLKQPVNLAEQVYQELRKEILDGVLEKGKQLTEISLSEKLGVSRTPVREAMKQLEAEGLVELRPNRGAIVCGILTQDIKDIYEIRSLIEGRCAEKAALKATKEEIDQLRETTDLTEFYLSRLDYDRMTAMDDRFHSQIYTMSGSRMYQKILAELHVYVESVREKSIKEPGRGCLMLKEHRDVLAAIEEKDAKKAGELMLKHIESSAEHMKKKHLIEESEEK